MFELESSIQKWIRTFNKHRAYDHGAIREMELHLRDHIEDLTGEGMSEREAFEEAVAEFGDIQQVAKEEFWNQKRKRTIRTMLYGTLFKNYYKTSIRSMLRSPLSSFINLFGLSAAIGICVFTYGFAQWTFRTDQFHENKGEVFLVTFFSERDGEIQQNGRSPRPLGERLKHDFTQIENVCRIENSQVVIKHEDHVFHQRITFADPSFLKLFTFPLEQGSITSLEDINSIILSQKIATKYFGDSDPIGAHLLVKFNENVSKTFVVTGVAEDFPSSLSFNFHFLINFDNLEVANQDDDPEDWSAFVDATFIHVKDNSSLSQLSEQMGQYQALQNESQQDWQISSFGFEPLDGLHKRSSKIRDSMIYSTDEGYMGTIFLAFVGVFMLALACFNYINIGIVSATKRLKEIGIRKTIGANQRVVIIQFLSENLIATSLALLIGLLIGTYIFVPWFESLFYFDMGFKLLDSTLWVYLAIVLFFTAIASGLYPSLYISRFPVTGILNRSVRFGKKNRLTKVILGMQLVFSCMFITSAVMFTQNANYLASRSWGYNENQALYIELPSSSGYTKIKSALLKDADVLSISGSSHHLGRSSKSSVIELPNRKHEVEQLAVGANYFTTLGIEIIDGRPFKHRSEADKKSILINESFVEKILPINPIGQTVKLDSVAYSIVGVVKDFHLYKFDVAVEPTIFTLASPEDYRFLSMKVIDGQQNETYKALQENWSELFPETPFQGGYQEDVWGMYFVEIDIHGKIWRGIAIIAILLASLGLYGLVALNVSGRAKEFSIRKVLGAQVPNIARNISKQYLFLFLIALGIGGPASYLLLSFVLDIAYTYHMPMDLWGVSIAMSTLFSVLLIVVTIQLAKVSRANPVEDLNIE